MARPFVQADENKRSYHSGLTERVNQQHVGTIVFDPVDYASYALARFEEVAQKMPEARDEDKQTFSFATGKYRPPFRVSVRTSVDWNVDHAGTFNDGQWEFTLLGPQYLTGLEMKLVLSRITGGIFWMEGHNIWIPPKQNHRHLTETDVFFAYKIRYQTKLWQPNHLVTLRTDDDGWGRDLYGVFENNVWTFLLDRANYSDKFAAKLVLDRHQYMNKGSFSITAAKAQYEIKDKADKPSAGTDYYITFPGTPSAYVHGYDNFTPLETPLEQLTIRSVGGEEEEYDVIVIGSGMGGGIVANALSDRGARTLVLDAGGLWFPLQINELPGIDVDLSRRDELGHFVNLDGSDLLFGVHFNLGGRSVYWSGVIPRMRPWEMRGLWPESVRKYLMDPGEDGAPNGYDRAEKLMRKGKTLGPFQNRMRDYLNGALAPEFEVLDLPRSLHQPNLNNDGEIQNVLEKPTGVFSTTDLLLDSLGSSGRAGRMNLRINLHHLATKIEKEDGRVTGVVCQDLIGNVERRYRGWYIVLACGSLESAKLALNSGLRDDSHKMGTGLTDHPAYFYQRHHVLPRNGPCGWIGDLRGHGKFLIQHCGATPSKHAYNIELLVNPKYWDARHADDNLWSELSDNEKDSKVEIKFIFGSPLVDGNFIKPKAPGQKPDVFVESNYSGHPFKQEVVDVRNRILKALRVSDPLTTTWIDDEWSRLVQGTVHHAGGTLRMSADNSGVVDENLKFRAYDNLYCCDVSVFPTIPAANPSLTLSALALRLADTLADRLGLRK